MGFRYLGQVRIFARLFGLAASAIRAVLFAFTLDGDTGTPQAVDDGNTVNIAGGTGISTAVGDTDTLTVNLDIDKLESGAPVDTDTLVFKDADDTNTPKEASIADILALANAGGLVPIADVTLVSDTAAISLTSIPGTYAHLKIVGQLRSDRASNDNDGLSIIFNSDTTATSYAFIKASQSQAGAGSGEIDNSNGAIEPTIVIPAESSPSGYFGTFSARIIDYISTSQFRHLMGFFQVHRTTTTGNHGTISGIWKNNTTAITQIDISPLAGSNFIAGSRLTLYGMADA